MTPKIGILGFAGRGGPTKYLMKSELNEENIIKFYEDFIAKKLTPYVKSEPIPEKNDGPVKTVVADNYNSIVLDKKKNVLVKYYAPWCGHCKALQPIYEALAKNFESVDDLVFAEMDATANEVAGLKISSYPTLKFYPKGNKTPIDFNQTRTDEGFIKFFKEQGIKIPKNLEEPEVEDEDKKPDEKEKIKPEVKEGL